MLKTNLSHIFANIDHAKKVFLIKASVTTSNLQSISILYSGQLSNNFFIGQLI